MLEKIKSKITNPFLKDNLTLENIANFFANFIAGNNFINNLEVKELAELNKVEIKESLKVKNEAQIDTLSFNKLKSRVMSIDDNEITFDPDTTLKMKNSKIAFKISDVFEVITFSKYIVKICGSKLEKCDFNTLLKNHNANQLMQLITAFQKKQEKFIEAEKKKISVNIQKIQQEKKSNLKQEKKDKDEKKIETPKVKAVENIETKNSHLEEIEKEITREINTQTTSAMTEDYDKFLQNPQLFNFLTNYYYELPNTNDQL